MKYFKNHPFAVEAHFDRSLVLTFAVPKEELQRLIPECLELDTFQDQWAFIAMALVKTSCLRPKGFPKFMGSNFFLTGYRIFVRFTNSDGRRLRGLYILKSETDKKRMEIAGNFFTHYNYLTTDIDVSTSENGFSISSKKSKFTIEIEYPNGEINLPSESPFANWKEARRFAGPLPHTYTYNASDNTVLIIEGVRKNWHPEPVQVKNHQIGFLNDLKLNGLILANAFEVRDINYYWKKGRIEKWK